MSPIRNFDHVGITVEDLDTVTAFFAGLGLETEGRTVPDGEFLDTVIGIPDSRRDQDQRDEAITTTLLPGF
jgi:catechol 2,3-dioxygenase-like lactoylglutathione lyase family enzyme